MSGASDVPIKTLLLTVFNSVAEVIILCVAGYILSRAGVTDKATQRKLNVINVSLFTPALLFSKVAYALTPEKLKEMWIIPLGFVGITALSAAVAWVLSRMFKLSRSQSAFAICAAMFQNSNSLPIALIQSLVVEVPGLKWDEDDNKDQMLGRALTYLVLYSTLGMMLRWSWGVKLLSQADDEVPDVDSAPLPQPATNSQTKLSNGTAQIAQSPESLIPHPGARETDPFFSTHARMSQDEVDERRNPTRNIDGTMRRDQSPDPAHSPDPSVQWTTGAASAHSMRPAGTRRGSSMSRHSGSVPPGMRRKPTRTDSAREFWGLPEEPRRHRIMLPEDVREDSSDESDEEWGSLTPVSLRRRQSPRGPPLSRFKSFLRQAKQRTHVILKSVNAFLTVPMYAALLSIFIALIPPLQRTLQRMKPLEQAIKSAGACSIPVTLVVLGAFFYTPPSPPEEKPRLHDEDDDEHGQNGIDHPKQGIAGFFQRHLGALRSNETPSASYPGENKAVFVAVVSRMIITPLLMMPLLALMAKYDLFEAAADPVFVLSAVLLVSSPPALTLAQITQAASGDAFERLISKTISWSYAVLTPPLTLVYVVIGLVFGRL